MDRDDLLWLDVISDNCLALTSCQEPEWEKRNVDLFFVEIEFLKVLDCSVSIADVQ